MGVTRFEVYLVNLDPTIGSEIRKTRPCVVVSPDEMNQQMRTFVVAAMTTTDKPYPSRVPCSFAGREGFVALDQLRTIDPRRAVRRLGSVSEAEGKAILATLGAMFAP